MSDEKTPIDKMREVLLGRGFRIAIHRGNKVWAHPVGVAISEELTMVTFINHGEQATVLYLQGLYDGFKNALCQSWVSINEPRHPGYDGSLWNDAIVT